MRLLLMATLFLCSFSSYAQSDLRKQLRSILSDTASGFRSFTGAFKKIAYRDDSTYYSTITIEGTSKNDITIDDTLGNRYIAYIVDSVRKKKAKATFDEWKNKIQAVLGVKFYPRKYEKTSYNPAEESWVFEYGRTRVSITWFSYGKVSQLYWVFLSVSYEPDNYFEKARHYRY